MDCPTCGRSLSTKQGMRQHHTKAHGDPLPNRTCEGCDTEFYDPKTRRRYCDDCDPNAGEHNGNWKGRKNGPSANAVVRRSSTTPPTKRACTVQRVPKWQTTFSGNITPMFTISNPCRESVTSVTRSSRCYPVSSVREEDDSAATIVSWSGSLRSGAMGRQSTTAIGCRSNEER